MGIKILLITDVHYSERSEEQEERWFPAKIKKMPKKKIDDYLKYWDGLTQRAFRKLLKKTKSQGPFDFLIDLGDGTAGTNQRGLVTKKAREERQKYDQLIARAFSGIRKYSLYGNHDIGYSDILIQEKVDGRMSRESFDVAEKLIGPPWFSKTIEGFTLLFLNSEIIRSSTEKDNPDQEFFIQKAKEQEKFIQECLKNTSDKISPKNPRAKSPRDPTPLDGAPPEGLFVPALRSGIRSREAPQTAQPKAGKLLRPPFIRPSHSPCLPESRNSPLDTPSSPPQHSDENPRKGRTGRSSGRPGPCQHCGHPDLRGKKHATGHRDDEAYGVKGGPRS